MKELPSAKRLASEEANHFNPAFCGALIYEFVRAYERAMKEPVPYALVFCALPIALHPATRNRLPTTIATGMFSWFENNPDVRVGFAERARNLTPFIRQAITYATMRQAICFESGGVVRVGSKRASFPQAALDRTTTEVRETVNAAKKIARWFGAAGDATTILAAWGLRV